MKTKKEIQTFIKELKQESKVYQLRGLDRYVTACNKAIKALRWVLNG
jgi:hypothetical protein|tara:strand:- start:538 stop:678 length:141 start_codon:yes stop_codon:yes gene_type:complete